MGGNSVNLQYKLSGLFKRAFNKKNSEHMPEHKPLHRAPKGVIIIFFKGVINEAAMERVQV